MQAGGRQPQRPQYVHGGGVVRVRVSLCGGMRGARVRAFPQRARSSAHGRFVTARCPASRSFLAHDMTAVPPEARKQGGAASPMHHARYMRQLKGTEKKCRVGRCLLLPPLPPPLLLCVPLTSRWPVAAIAVGMVPHQLRHDLLHVAPHPSAHLPARTATISHISHPSAQCCRPYARSQS